MNIDRLEELLVSSIDVEFAEADRVELNTILRADSDARDFAAQFLATDGLLVDALETGEIEQQFSLKRRSRRFWIGAMAMAALLALLVVPASLFFAGDREAVATIQAAHQEPGYSAGALLQQGEILKLSKGQIKIAFVSGAKLAVQGPAELEILGPNSARLHRGLVTVRVPGPTKGFSLETPAKRVVDLGTAFGVDVKPSGETSVTVFEGEIEIGRAARNRLLAGSAVHVSADQMAPDEAISYNVDAFMDTWRFSFGVDGLVGDVRFAKPGEREKPGKVIDNDSLLLIPEREGVELPSDSELAITQPGKYSGPFPWSNPSNGKSKSKRPAKASWNNSLVSKATLVDSYLLQYNPMQPSPTTKDKRFITEVRFDRPVIGIIAHKDMLVKYDALFAYPKADFSGILNRGLYENDEITLSADRRTVRVAFDIVDGVDQIRVLVESHFEKPLSAGAR